MKKIELLVLIIFLLFLQSCRTEDFLDNSVSDRTSSDKISSRRIFPAEFQKIPELNAVFSRSEATLIQKIKTGKNILNEAIIDSAYALETTNGVVISYTFPVYRENQGRYFDNLVLQRKIGEQGFTSYLYRYHSKEGMRYDQKNIEIYDLNMVTPDAAGKILITSNTIQNGCSSITVNSVDCGEGGHHTNGAWCPTLHIFMPYDTVVTTDICTGVGGPGGNNGGNPPTGGGNPPAGGGNTGDGGQVITSPVITYPKYGYCRRGYHWDPLGLDAVQLSFVNSQDQNALRGEMGVFFTNNEVFPFDCNSPNTITPEVKTVGIWIVNYAMSNSGFLNSEFRDKFLKSDFQFQQWAMNYLIQHPDVSWEQFENWFIKNPCEKTKTILQNSKVKTNIESLEQTSKTTGEQAFLYQNDNTASNLIDGDEHSVDLSAFANYKGIYHNHTPLGVKMFSVSDIIKLYKTVMNQMTPLTMHDAFIAFVAYENCNCSPDNYLYHNYILRFNGDMSQVGSIANLGAEEIQKLIGDYDKAYFTLRSTTQYRTGNDFNADLNAKGVEKLFFSTLENMNINPNTLILQKVEKDGTVNNVNLKVDGTTFYVKCP